jgi:hypothetical protein
LFAALLLIVLSACSDLRETGCATVESACKQTCRAGDMAQRRACEDRCAAQNPCRAG